MIQSFDFSKLFRADRRNGRLVRLYAFDGRWRVDAIRSGAVAETHDIQSWEAANVMFDRLLSNHK